MLGAFSSIHNHLKASREELRVCLKRQNPLIVLKTHTVDGVQTCRLYTLLADNRVKIVLYHLGDQWGYKLSQVQSKIDLGLPGLSRTPCKLVRSPIPSWAPP